MRYDLVKYGSRKFLVASGVIIGANVQCAFDKIDSGTYAVVVGLAVALYQYANSAESKNAKASIDTSGAS